MPAHHVLSLVLGFTSVVASGCDLPRDLGTCDPDAPPRSTGDFAVHELALGEGGVRTRGGTTLLPARTGRVEPDGAPYVRMEAEGVATTVEFGAAGIDSPGVGSREVGRRRLGACTAPVTAGSPGR